MNERGRLWIISFIHSNILRSFEIASRAIPDIKENACYPSTLLLGSVVAPGAEAKELIAWKDNFLEV